MEEFSLFDKIPNELILNIMTFIEDPQTLTNFVACCVRFRNIARIKLPNFYWRYLYAKKWYLYEQELKAFGKKLYVSTHY
jgi:hypothetical protein